MARFTRIVPFRALDAGTLKDILRANVIDRLTREFEDEGFKLVVTEPALDFVVARERCVARPARAAWPRS